MTPGDDIELGRIGTFGIVCLLLAALVLLAGCANAQPPPPNVIERIVYVTDWDKCEVVCAPFQPVAACRVAEDEGACRCKDGAKVSWRTEPGARP